MAQSTLNSSTHRRRQHHSGTESKVAGVFGFLFRNQYGLVLMNALLVIVFLFLSNSSTTGPNYNSYQPAAHDVPRTLSAPSVRSPAKPETETPPAAAPVRSEPCPNPPPANQQQQQQQRQPPSTSMANAAVEYNDAETGNTATVMAMATGYSLYDYESYVGSLRKTGFTGNIILAVAPNIDRQSEDYLKSKNVIVKKVQYVDCSHPVKDTKAADADNFHDRELLTCLDPYPKLKHRWARFPLLRDFLLECGGHERPEIQCGGPVLISDLRDTFFQRNPFGPEAPKVRGLQVFREHYTIRTTHWLVDWPVGDCKGVHYDEPMLCSGTTIGTRQAMLDYLEIFHQEMNTWMESPKCCCFDTNGDDQSMHNYLYYSGMLNGVNGGVEAVTNRAGLVHTVGGHASIIFNTHTKAMKELLEAKNDPENPPSEANSQPYQLSYDEDENDRSKNWLGLQYGLTDADGYFVNNDGSRSFIIHQFDRFGPKFGAFYDAHKDRYFV